MTEITDSKSLERWLEGKPQDVCVLIAARAALRVYSILLLHGIGGDEADVKLLLTASRAVVSSVAAAGRTAGEADLTAAARSAADSASSLYSSESDAFSAAFAAAAAAASTADSAADRSADSAAASAAFSAAFSAAASNASAYFAVSNDASLIEDEHGHTGSASNAKLWHSLDMPEAIATNSQTVVDTPGIRGGPWAFWIAWYEGFLNGRPLDWELQREVALIPDEDWQKGVEHIAGEIAKIELKYRTAIAPRLVRDEEASLFRLEEEPALPEEVLGFVCDRIATVLQNALDAANNNGLGEGSYETITIRRALEQHRERPTLLATGLYDACLSFSATIGERYPEDTSLINLRNALWAATEEICEVSEPARKQCARLASLAQPLRLTDADRAEVALVPDAVADELNAEAEAVLRLTTDMLVTDDVPSKSARARFTHWVTTISIWMDRAMKEDQRAQWLASVVERLARWWPEDM